VWTKLAVGESRILPDGCMDIIWMGDHLLVAGPDTHAQPSVIARPTTLVGLRFPPGAGPAVLGIPAYELRDQRVPLDAVWTRSEAERIGDRIGAGESAAAVLEWAALDRLTTTGRLSPVTAEVVRRLRSGQRVATVADAVGMSSRQLHRLALAAFGYAPKTLARVMRMQRALALAHRGMRLGEVAAMAGYADQAHLSREVKELAGEPLSVLVARTPQESAAQDNRAKRSTELPSGSIRTA